MRREPKEAKRNVLVSGIAAKELIGKLGRNKLADPLQEKKKISVSTTYTNKWLNKRRVKG